MARRIGGALTGIGFSFTRVCGFYVAELSAPSFAFFTTLLLVGLAQTTFRVTFAEVHGSIRWAGTGIFLVVALTRGFRRAGRTGPLFYFGVTALFLVGLTRAVIGGALAFIRRGVGRARAGAGGIGAITRMGGGPNAAGTGIFLVVTLTRGFGRADGAGPIFRFRVTTLGLERISLAGVRVTLAQMLVKITLAGTGGRRTLAGIGLRIGCTAAVIGVHFTIGLGHAGRAVPLFHTGITTLFLHGIGFAGARVTLTRVFLIIVGTFASVGLTDAGIGIRIILARAGLRRHFTDALGHTLRAVPLLGIGVTAFRLLGVGFAGVGVTLPRMRVIILLALAGIGRAHARMRRRMRLTLAGVGAQLTSRFGHAGRAIPLLVAAAALFLLGIARAVIRRTLTLIGFGIRVTRAGIGRTDAGIGRGIGITRARVGRKLTRGFGRALSAVPLLRRGATLTLFGVTGAVGRV